MSTATFRERVGATRAKAGEGETPEIACFRSACPLLCLGLLGSGVDAESAATLKISLEHYQGKLQATLRLPSTGEFAYYEVNDPLAFWESLERAVDAGLIYWQQGEPSKKRKS